MLLSALRTPEAPQARSTGQAPNPRPMLAQAGDTAAPEARPGAAEGEAYRIPVSTSRTTSV